MNSPQTYFHVGFARAASTFLQKTVFPALSGIQYIPRNRFRVRESEKRRFRQDKILMSREAAQNIYDRCEDVHRLFNSKIIISVRRHDTLIASYYRLHAKKGHNIRMPQFLDLDSDEGVWQLDQLRFMPLIEHAERVTGEPPLVLIFEQFIASPDEYLQSLTRWLECEIDRDKMSSKPVHKSYSDKQLRIRRQVADFFSSNEMTAEHLRSKSRAGAGFVHWFKYRLSLWFSALFMLFARFLPDSWLSAEPLIEADYLQRIRVFYEEDWQQVQEYVESQRRGLGIKASV